MEIQKQVYLHLTSLKIYSQNHHLKRVYEKEQKCEDKKNLRKKTKKDKD